MTSKLPSTIRPCRVGRLSAGVVAICLVLAAGCSSDSTSGNNQPNTDSESTDQVIQNEEATADTGDSELLAQAEVCDLVDPVALDLATAFGAGFELIEVHGASSRCQLDLVATDDSFVPSGTDADLFVLREPAVLGTDVAAHAKSYEVTGEAQSAPTVSDDAVVVHDDNQTIVLFSAGGRLWSVRGTVMAPASGDVGDATVAAAAVMRAGLLAA